MTADNNDTMHSEWRIQLLLFLVFLGMYALYWRIGYGGQLGNVFGDVALTGAERVLAGDIPYRDFWTLYAPGSFYLLALLFKLFGHHYLVSTVTASALCAGAGSLCYRTVIELGGRRAPALAAAAIFFAATYSTNYYLALAPYPPTILLVLATLFCLARYYRLHRPGWLFAAGLACGAVILFKHDVGGYTGIAISAGLLTGLVPAWRRPAGHSPWFALFLFAAAAALVALPVAVYFAVLAGPDMWRDLIVFPATDFHITRGEHYPELIPVNFQDTWWLRTVFNLFYRLPFSMLFLLAIGALLYLLWTALRRQHAQLPMVVTLFVAYLLHYFSAHVQINTNIMSMALYGGLLGALAYGVAAHRPGRPRRRWLQSAAVAVSALLVLTFMAEPVYNRLRSDAAWVELELPRVSGLRVAPDIRDSFVRLVQFFDAHVAPGERIFVGLHRHDTTVIGDGKLYYILNRLDATTQDQLHPGIADTAPVQRAMIHDLQRYDVRYLVIRHVFSDKDLDRLRKIWSVTLPNSGATVLDEYLRQTYRPLEEVGQYEIWGRKDLAPPAGGPG
jgi:hypothetical protein